MNKRRGLRFCDVSKLLSYNPKTGIFVRLSNKTRTDFVGRKAGYLNHTGYLFIKIHGRGYNASNIAWLLMTHHWPTMEVDHKNRIRSDCRWENLRLATRGEQTINRGIQKNNTSGFTGVRPRKDGLFWAYVYLNRNQYSIGYFRTAKAAAKARASAAKRLHGQFAVIPTFSPSTSSCREWRKPSSCSTWPMYPQRT
jgi:hypothetical protein